MNEVEKRIGLCSKERVISINMHDAAQLVSMEKLGMLLYDCPIFNETVRVNAELAAGIPFRIACKETGCIYNQNHSKKV